MGKGKRNTCEALRQYRAQDPLSITLPSRMVEQELERLVCTRSLGNHLGEYPSMIVLDNPDLDQIGDASKVLFWLLTWKSAS